MKNRLYEITCVCFGIAALSFGLCFFHGQNVQAEEKEEISYIVTVKSDEAFAELTEEYEQNLEKPVDNMEEDRLLVVSVTGEEAVLLQEDSRVEAIEEDVVVHGCGEGDTAETTVEWNLDAINAAQNTSVQSEEKIKVAVLDSGIDYSEDIDVKERLNFIPGQDNVSVLYEDSTGHGTCIAGILAAKDNELGITGINSNIELYSARVLDYNNSSRVSRIIDAINWAIEKKVNILSLSFGTTTNSEALHDAIKKAQEHNILIVAAAGNEAQVEYPAAYPEVIAVGSIGTDGLISESSATGEELELVAPGEQILSTGAFDGVMTCAGTSMAVPHVVGVASLLWEKDSTADAEFIRMVLDAGAKTYNNKETYGYGLVDYEYANSIYDACKAVYESKKGVPAHVEELQQDGILEENTGIINTETYEEVDYVEGLWGTNKHQELADEGQEELLTTKLTTKELAILKLGAVANDTYVQGMILQPQWHGYWKNKHTLQKSNYVANYLYISTIAMRHKQGNVSTTVNQSGVDAAMKNIVNPSGIRMIESDKNTETLTDRGIIPWGQVLNGESLTMKNKSLFLYGMALHCATDTFAHSTNRLDGTAILHKDSNEGNKNVADDAAYYGNRITCAREIAKKVLSNYLSTSPGDVSDFFITRYDGSFYLTNISENIKVVNNAYYSANKSYFDRLNYSKNP